MAAAAPLAAGIFGRLLGGLGARVVGGFATKAVGEGVASAGAKAIASGSGTVPSFAKTVGRMYLGHQVAQQLGTLGQASPQQQSGGTGANPNLSASQFGG